MSVATSTITGAEIYPGPQKGQYTVITDEPIQWINNDLVSVTGLSTTSSNIEGTYNVGISSNRFCLLYTSPSPRDATLSRMPASA